MAVSQYHQLIAVYHSVPYKQNQIVTERDRETESKGVYKTIPKSSNRLTDQNTNHTHVGKDT